MIDAECQDNLVFEEPMPSEKRKEKRRKGNCYFIPIDAVIT